MTTQLQSNKLSKRDAELLMEKYIKGEIEGLKFLAWASDGWDYVDNGIEIYFETQKPYSYKKRTWLFFEKTVETTSIHFHRVADYVRSEEAFVIEKGFEAFEDKINNIVNELKLKAQSIRDEKNKREDQRALENRKIAEKFLSS